MLWRAVASAAYTITPPAATPVFSIAPGTYTAAQTVAILWTLAADEPVNLEVPKYLNRLSDLLFVIARVLARHESGAEVLWRHDRGR